MALRKTRYDKIEERGLFFRSYLVFPNKTKEPFKVWRRSTYEKNKAERDEVGAVYADTEGGGVSGGGRDLWWTRSGLFWADPGMTAADVTLLQQPATTTTTASAATTTTAAATTTTTESAAADIGAGSTSLEASAEAGLGDIEVDTLWQEVFDTFTAAEQSCVREAVDDAYLETLLQAPVLSEDAELPVAAMFACLRPETSDAIWISALITGIAEEESLDLSSTERSCIQERLAGVLSGQELAGLIAEDDSVMGADELTTVTAILFECVPDLFVQGILSELGIDPDDLSEHEMTCLRELATDTDWRELSSASYSGAIQDDRTVVWMTTSAFDCVPDLFVQEVLSEMVTDPDDLSEQEMTCLRELATDTDWRELWSASDSGGTYDQAADRMTSGLLQCLPDLILDSLSAFAGDGAFPDDHADRLEDATPIRVGEAVAAAMDYPGDIDFFSFDAEQGEAYQIDVAPDGFWDSTATLYDGKGSLLEFNDDHEDSLASRIVWTAPASESFHVAVASWWETGTYTLTVTRQ